MAVSYQEIFNIFDGKIRAIDWLDVDDLNEAEDKRNLLDSALTFFLFPRCDLESRDSNGFLTDFSNVEKQMIATLMKNEWVKRCVTNWRNIELQYHTKDWELSNQANHLLKLIMLQESVQSECDLKQRNYDRSRNYHVMDFSTMAGRKR